MGKLFDVKLKIEKQIKLRGLDEHRTKGLIGLESGMVIGFIRPTTPDDAEKLAMLKSAAEKVLEINFD